MPVMAPRKKRTVTPRTLADVARVLKVDPSTVSLALSGSTKISDKTRQRVLDYCKKVHFQPNYLARSLSQRKSGLWGILLPSIESSFFPQVLGGIEEVVNGLGLTSLLAVSNFRPELLRRQVAAMAAKRVEGLLINPCLGGDEEREIMIPYVEEIPTVWLMHALPGNPEDSCVRVNNEIGGYMGTHHLIQHGHKRIGFLAGNQTTFVANERLNGWRRALTEAGLEADDSLIAGTDFSVHSGYLAAQKLMSLPNPPTAFMSCSDYGALGAIDYLLRQDIHPGPEFGVIGFDGICCANHSPISLTTINQPKRELGLLAAQTLSAMIGGSSPQMPMLDPTLVIRRSCGCSFGNGR